MQLVLLGSAVLTAALVYLVPNFKWLNSAKALIAGATPLVVAILVNAREAEITRLAVPLITLVLTFGTSNGQDPEGVSPGH